MIINISGCNEKNTDTILSDNVIKILTISEQIDYFANHSDVWSYVFDDEYSSRDSSEFYYAVTDLGHNERLEIITSIYAGTARYTYNKFTEINETYDGLITCRLLIREDSQPDISQYDNMSMYRDKNDDIYYYLCEDLTLNRLVDIYDIFNGKF